MTFQLDLNAIAQMSTLRIVDCLLEGTLIAIFAAVVLRSAPLRHSSTRFAVWFSALMAISALPLLTGVTLTGVSLPVASWQHGTDVSAQTLTRSVISLPGSWALYVFCAWVAIAAWFLMGIGRGLWHLYVLRKSCVPVGPAALDARLHETLARNSTPRPVALCTSDRVHVPTAIGLVNPTVVIPTWVMQELSSDELNQILLHELAHLRRWDDWTNLAQKLVKALFFFHPAVWWIERKVSLEREMACDDAVLAQTARPRAYAECLAHLAEKTLMQRGLIQHGAVQRSVALAQAALGRIRQTSLRVASILDVNRPAGSARACKTAISLVAAFAIACVLCISRAPRLIAFHDNPPGNPSVSTIAAISPSAGSASPGAPFLARSVPVKWGLTRAKATALATHRKPAIPVNTAAPQPTVEAQLPASLVHLTSTDVVPFAFSETLFVVVEGSPNGTSEAPVFRIQLWRVVVLHPVVDPNSSRIPPKQI